MKLRLKKLTAMFQEETVEIALHDVNYFYGPMGAGKSSIGKLIDYCLGGGLDPSPALQREFVAASIQLELSAATLTLDRSRDSARVTARWSTVSGEGYSVSLPARHPDGVVLPGTDVETLSDLIFHLSNVAIPKIRTSRIRDNAELRRLSMRDLLWYCYLSQDEIDSTFFHLDKSDNPKLYKSRNVLRFVLGFRTERISEIEEELERLRGERLALTASIDGLTKVLAEVGAESEGELLRRIEALRAEADAVGMHLEQLRSETRNETNARTHEADNLRVHARELGRQLADLDGIRDDMIELLRADTEHLNEVETLTIKFRRSVSARAVLQGVAFVRCPRCAQALPPRDSELCGVCGQPDAPAIEGPDSALLEQDAKARITELRDVIDRRKTSVLELTRRREELLIEKGQTESRLAAVLRAYDSAYLSRALGAEREQAALVARASDLERMLRFPQMVERHQERVERIGARQSALRNDLLAARQAAERDSANVGRLKDLFLDCLLRTALDGIAESDVVDLDMRNFLPQVRPPQEVQRTVTTFSNISSGGKKTLFKACFAVAVHRLAVAIGATLPELLIVDSPMKNISERENRLQFERFHQMLYELKRTELRDTQLVLIDKEFFPPDNELGIDIAARRMQPNEPGVLNPFPPLIPYYTGH